jgi:hypothetical protein
MISIKFKLRPANLFAFLLKTLLDSPSIPSYNKCLPINPKYGFSIEMHKVKMRGMTIV